MKDNDQYLIWEAYLEEAKGGRWDSANPHLVEEMIYAIEMIHAMSFEDWYKRVIMGGHFRDLQDLSSLVNFYSHNKASSRGQRGPSGAPLTTIGPWQAAKNLVDKLIRYLNPLGLDLSKARPRVYETPEFAQQHNKAEYDEYDRLHRDAWRGAIGARKEDDRVSYSSFWAKKDEYAKLRDSTEFQQARSKAYKEEEEMIKQLQTTPFTMDNWNNLPPEAQQEILTSYENVRSASAASN